MGSTRGIRLEAREHAEAAAATMRPLDAIDKAILDWEYGFPATGPHADRVGIRLDGYKTRVHALLANPLAESWAPESVFRLRARYGNASNDRVQCSE